MENTVTMSLEKYDEMKRKIQLQDDEIRFWRSCDNDGLVKITCMGLFGNESYEFSGSDTAVKEINEKIQDERDKLRKERDLLKSLTKTLELKCSDYKKGIRVFAVISVILLVSFVFFAIK